MKLYIFRNLLHERPDLRGLRRAPFHGFDDQIELHERPDLRGLRPLRLQPCLQLLHGLHERPDLRGLRLLFFERFNLCDLCYMKDPI